MPFLTIFTPTYNRKELLPNLYQSLCQQTNKDFLWLVVDVNSSKGGGVSGNHEQFDRNFLGDDQIKELSFFMNNGMAGDHCEVVTVKEFCKYPFPDYPGEKFMGEAWLWYNIAKSGPVAFINKVIYLCEYLEGGLTNSGRAMRLRNPIGGQEHARVYLGKEFKNKTCLKNAMLYVCYGRIAGQSIKKMIKDSKQTLLVLVAYIPEIALKTYWLRKYTYLYGKS